MDEICGTSLLAESDTVVDSQIQEVIHGAGLKDVGQLRYMVPHGDLSPRAYSAQTHDTKGVRKGKRRNEVSLRTPLSPSCAPSSRTES